MERKEQLKEGLSKAYALIFNNYCTRAMQARIEEHPEFETKIEDDPIQLLEVIKTLTHDTVRAQYPIASMTDAYTRFLNARQQENEFLLDYVKRFKQLRDVVKTQIGTGVLDQYAERTESYKNAKNDDNERKEVKKNEWDKFTVYLLMRSVDQNQYGTLLKNLSQQYSLSNNQYPKMIVVAMDVLSNHRIDQKFFDNRKKNQERMKNTEQKNDDEESKPQETSFVQGQEHMTCYVCGESGHGANNCDKQKTLPRNEWYVNKAMSNLQHEEAGTKDHSDDNKSNQDRSKSDNKKSGLKVGWCTFQSAALKATTLKQTNKTESKFKNEIILDTGSTLPATFMSPDMVTNIKDSRYPLVMNTNAGSKMLTKQADVRGFGKAWLDEDQMANIFRFAGTVDHYKVTYNSTKEDAFNVHTENGIVKFKRNKEGLYTYKPNTSFYNEVAEAKRNETSHMVTTVTENKVRFTKRQVKDAKRQGSSTTPWDAQQYRTSSIY